MQGSRLLVSCVLLLALVPLWAHTLSDTVSRLDCTLDSTPPVNSYHLHVLFWPDGERQNTVPQGSVEAIKFRSEIIKHFHLTDVANCTALIDPSGALCAFPIDWRPGYNFAHPFLVPNFAFFVPVERFADVVSWVMMNRGPFDVLVHPNTGCPVQDHTAWAFWMGQKWELKMSF